MRRHVQSNLAAICNHLLAEESGSVPLRIAVLAFTFLAFVLAIVLFGTSMAWGQDASTGALRGSVVDAQGAAVTSADVVAISVDTESAITRRRIRRDDLSSTCCRRERTRPGPKRKVCRRRSLPN